MFCAAAGRRRLLQRFIGSANGLPMLACSSQRLMHPASRRSGLSCLGPRVAEGCPPGGWGRGLDGPARSGLLSRK